MPELFAPSFTVEIDERDLGAEKTVSSLVVTHEANTMDSFDLTLVNAFPDLRWTRGADANVFREGAGVVIEMGYVGDLEQMFDGVVTTISPDFPADGVPTVRIHGVTRAHQLSQSTTTRTFVGKTASEIVEEIALGLNMAAEVEPTEEPLEYVIQYDKTDLDFLVELGRRIGYEFDVDGDTLSFSPQAGAAVYTLVWAGGQLGYTPGATAMPLRSFTPTMNTLQQPTKATVRAVDPGTGDMIEATVDDVSPSPPPGL